MGDAGTTIEHCKPLSTDRDDAAARQLTAQQDQGIQVIVNTLSDVAVVLVSRTILERLWVWVACGRLAMEERYSCERSGNSFSNTLSMCAPARPA